MSAMRILKQCRKVPRKLPAEVYGDFTGKQLREMGYSFFAENGQYFVCRPDKAGFVHVTMFVEDSGMDDEGFGREFYYDHYLMDQRLRPIPGVKVFQCMSSHDLEDRAQKWQVEQDKAAAYMQNPWYAFVVRLQDRKARRKNSGNHP